MREDVSQIEWPDQLKAKPDMCYESIATLYSTNPTDLFQSSMSFAVSCSNFESYQPDLRGCIHKLDINGASSLAEAKIKVTHEVLPNQGACSQIIPVNEKLRVACFDEGSILPISNFGPKKTFHCDVRGRLQHHSAPVNCITSNTTGTQVASGSTGGEIALYEVSAERIDYIARANVSSTTITGLQYLTPHKDICLRPNEGEVLDGEKILIYSTQDGHIGLLDTRCDLGQRIDFTRLMTTEPRLNLTTLCYVDSLPGQVIFLGSAQGQLIAVDLRCTKEYLVDRKLPGDGCIRRMKSVSLETEDNKTEVSLAYTNGTHEIRIISPNSLEIDEQWRSDRISSGIVRDFCLVGRRIITCGTKSSIGCWIRDG